MRCFRADINARRAGVMASNLPHARVENSEDSMSEGLSVFLNLALFVGVFYLILVYAGMPDKRRDRIDRRTEVKRVA